MINLRRILTATDFSACSKEALDYAVYLAKALGADLYLMYVFEPPLYIHSGAWPSIQPEIHQYMDQVREEEIRKLNTLAGELRSQAREVHVLFKEGVPFLEIIKAAEEIRSDLIVLGTHGRTGLAHMLLGSVAERVVQRSPCPVFSVRPKALASQGIST